MGAVAEVATEVVETVAGAAEETIEALDHINNLNGTTRLQQGIVLGGVALVSAGVTGFIVYKVVNRRLQAKYDIMLEEEMEKARTFLHEQALKVDKAGEYEDPTEMLRRMVEGGYEPNSEEAALLLDTPEEVDVIVSVDDDGLTPTAGVKDYTALYTATNETIEDLKAGERVTEILEEVKVVTKTVFEKTPEATVVDEWDLINEELFANGKPHVISDEDYLENEDEWEQTSLVYFAEDDTLVDDTEITVEDPEGVVGEINLKRFGWKSGDPKIVYVKQPEYRNLFEIVYSDGSYAKEVLGLRHSEEVFEPRRRRPRRGDDE